MPHGQIASLIDGPALRTRREHSGMSLQDLANECEKAGHSVYRASLSRIERGLSQPRPKLLLTLANVFGVSVAELLKSTKAAA